MIIVLRCVGRFFDITGGGGNATGIAKHARYVEDGLLFIAEGRIAALMSWEKGSRICASRMTGWICVTG